MWDFPTRHVGKRVHVFERVVSTNTLAASLAGPAGERGPGLAR